MTGIKKLCELGKVVTGNTPSTSEQEYYSANDICFVKPGDIRDSEVTDIEESSSYISETAREVARLVPPGSVLVTCIGIVGKIAVTRIECAINQQINAIIPCGDVNEKYLAYALLFNRQKMISRANAAVVPIINKTQFSSIEIPVHSLRAQHEIVSILDAVSEMLRLRKAQLAELDNLVKSQFVKMFGIPGDNVNQWDEVPFSSVCIDMHQGINTVADKVEYVDNGVPIIQSKNITSGYLDLDDVRYVKESDYEYYREKYNPKPSDLLICNIGTIGKSLIVEIKVNFLIAWNLFLIKLNKELVNPIFVKVFIELLNQQNYFEKYMTGGTVKFVNKKTMGNISTSLPPMVLQNQFAEFVKQTDKSKFAIQQALDETQSLFDSLMAEYFEE